MNKKGMGNVLSLIIAIGVLITIGVICYIFGFQNYDSNNRNYHALQTGVSSSNRDDSDYPLGFKVIFRRIYRNDATGKLRSAQIPEDISIEEYAVDYYNNYFTFDDEVHIVINKNTRTTARITYESGMLNIRIMKYVDGEEYDAEIACTGELIKEYNVDVNTEKIEIEAETETEAETGAEAEMETEAEDPLGFKVVFSPRYRNDVTGRWRLAQISEDISIEEYAVDYYNNYFSADDEVHIVINTSTRTTACITYVFGMLDIRIMEYVDGEEWDAKIACSGDLISEYQVDISTGSTEKIQ